MNLGKDKYMHAAVCAIIAICSVVLLYMCKATLLTANIGGLLTAMSAGFAKEYGDKCNPNNKWDWQDVLADLIGSIIGLLLITLILVL